LTNCKKRDQRGFTLIELLITVTVLSFGLLGLAGLQVEMVRANAFNRHLLIAQNIGADLIEEAKGLNEAVLAASLAKLNNNIPFVIGDLYLTSNQTFANSITYGDIDGDSNIDAGDIDVGGDGDADTLYNNDFAWTRTITPAGTTSGKYSVEVTVFWPDRFSANPKQMSFKGIAPQG
jgi:prepilin-type N-terminal cleavage/methylation domain-containing protein